MGRILFLRVFITTCNLHPTSLRTAAVQQWPQVGPAAGAPRRSLEAAPLSLRPKLALGPQAGHAPGTWHHTALLPSLPPATRETGKPSLSLDALVPARPPAPAARPQGGRGAGMPAGERCHGDPRSFPLWSPGDYVIQAEDGDPGCCPYPWRRCVRDTGSRSGSAAPRRRAAATAFDPARCRHSAPGGGRTPRRREAGPRLSPPHTPHLTNPEKEASEKEA